MNTAAYHAHAPIEAQKVADDARIHTLPHHFGRHMLIVEDAVYRWMRRLAPEYSGGYWHFYELSNGGFYMAPDCEPLLLRVEGNGYEGPRQLRAPRRAFSASATCPSGFPTRSSARTSTSFGISPWSIRRRALSSQPSTEWTSR